MSVVTDITECSRVAPPDPFPTDLNALVEQVKKRNVHLFIAVPCYGCKMGVKFTTSLLRLEGFCLSHGIKMTIEFLGNESLITRGRCILAERAMKSNATHLFFIDADIGFEVPTVLRLIAFDAPVTAGIYAKKGLNFGDVIKASTHEPAKLMDAALNFNLNLDPEKKNHTVTSGFLKVHDAATGFMLIRMDALRKLREIYAPTHTVKNDIPSSRETLPEYVALFETIICPKTKRFLSEDYAFCRKAQENGFDVYADIMAPLSHTGEIMNHGDLSHLLQTKISL
jgi:hypothetical protein